MKAENQSSIVKRIKEICDEFDDRVNSVGLSFARAELAKALAETEADLNAALSDTAPRASGAQQKGEE